MNIRLTYFTLLEKSKSSNFFPKIKYEQKKVKDLLSPKHT